MAVLLSNRFQQPITIWRADGGFTDDGHPTTSAAINEMAKVDEQSKLIKNELGEEIATSHTIYLKTTCATGDFILFGTSLDAFPTIDAKRVLKYEQFVSTRTPSKVVKVAYL